MLQPAKLQILAASIFVLIPPLPNFVKPFILIFLVSLFKSLIVLINLASLYNFGFLVKSPSTSDSNIKVSALVIWATLEANLSLSPYFISEVAIVSFSFTIGM